MSKNEKDGSNEIEKINTGPTYFLEEDISIDEKYVKNKSLIRMDMNIVQFPIFSKNAKRKKNEVTTYYFNKNKDTFITIKPVAGELIPGEAEERVFIALMKLMKEKGMEQEFIVTAREVREAAKINSNNYISEIKRSLLRLSETKYNFKNTMYSNELNSTVLGQGFPHFYKWREELPNCFSSKYFFSSSATISEKLVSSSTANNFIFLCNSESI